MSFHYLDMERYERIEHFRYFLSMPYTVAACVLAFVSTAKKGTVLTNPCNLPAVGALIVCASHLFYADFCMSRYWILGIFIFYGFWAVGTIGVNLFDRSSCVLQIVH